MDDDEWEWWLSLTDAELDGIERREIEKYHRWINSMTPAEYYRYQRGSWLRIVAERRAFLKNPNVARIGIIDDITRESIGRARLTLVKLRSYRATGQWPGEG